MGLEFWGGSLRSGHLHHGRRQHGDAGMFAKGGMDAACLVPQPEDKRHSSVVGNYADTEHAMSNKPTESSFLKDVADHQMEIIRDDGLYRHIRFRQPDSSCYLFDLITWPGYLAYVGDMGSYVFSRLPDMFQFFRTDRLGTGRDDKNLRINLGYWAEKVEAEDKNGGLKEFDEDKFTRVIVERTVNWIRDRREDTTKEERRELWDAVVSEVIGADGDSGGYRKQSAAYDFSHEVRRNVWFQFDDLWESDFDRYTYRFVWCCYALAYGVLKYDEAKQPEQVEAA